MECDRPRNTYSFCGYMPGARRIQVALPKLQALQLARTNIYRQTKNRDLLEKGVSHHLTYF